MRLVTIDLDKAKGGYVAFQGDELMIIDAAFDMADVRPCGHCRDCKWWEPDSEYKTQGDCGMPKARGLTVWVETDRGLSGAITTVAEFGCVQFEPKEKP